MSSTDTDGPEPSPLAAAIDMLSRLDTELRTTEDGAIGDVYLPGVWETRKQLATVTDRINEQEQLDDERSLRETFRETVTFYRRFTSDETISEIDAARAVVAFHHHVLLTRQMLNAVSESHRGLVLFVGKTAREQVDALGSGDGDALRNATAMASANMRGFEALKESREELKERYHETLPAYDRLEIEPTDSSAQYLILRDDTFRGFGLLVTMFERISAGLLAVFDGAQAFESEQWATAQSSFADGHDQLSAARDVYDRLAQRSDEKAVETVSKILGMSFSTENEQAALELATQVIDIVAGLRDAAEQAHEGKITSAQETFKTEREQLQTLPV